MTNLEARLRAALSARALAVTADDLQPAVPPTAATGRRPRRLGRPWAALVAGAAAVALVAGVVAVRRPGDEGTTPAPNPPAATVPSQPASPSPAVSPEPGPARGSDGAPKGMPETSPKGSARPGPPVQVSPGRGAGPSTVPIPPPSFG